MNILARSKNLEETDAISALRRLISEGQYEAGDRLPSERDLIRELGISRNTLRKALGDLERAGMIWRHVGKGTFVTSPEVSQTPDRLAFLGRQLTPVKIMRARLAIEPAIAKEAAINASGEALSKMYLALDRERAASSWKMYEEQDDEFHRAIASGSDNLLLLSIFDELNAVRRSVAWGKVTRTSEKPSNDHTSFAEHEAIAEAIAARKPSDAYDLMHQHLRSVSARLFEEI